MSDQKFEFVAILHLANIDKPIHNLFFDGLSYYPKGYATQLELYSNALLRKGIGARGMNELNDNSIFYYSTTLSQAQAVFGKKVIGEVGVEVYSRIDSYVKLFWLLNDNSIFLGKGYVISGHTIQDYSNNYKVECSNGSYRDTKLNKVDLDYINLIWHRHQRFIYTDKKNSGYLFEEGQLIGNYVSVKSNFHKAAYSHNIIIRALVALHEARRAELLIMKIAFYIMMLESLFLFDDSTEVAHRVGERIALYMELDAEESVKIYKLIKKVYSTRSKFVHGQNVSKKGHDALVNESEEIDELLRMVLRKIHDSDDSIRFFMQKDENLNQHFLKAIFEEKPNFLLTEKSAK